MRAIYKRELTAYFHSFIGMLFIAVMLFFTGLYFSVYNLMNGYPYFSYVMSAVVFLFMISIPVLCMRILAEERRNRTDQLILTAPVSVGSIVLGKYLALLTIFAIPTLINCCYPLVMRMYGTVPLKESYLAILAFFLYGAACIAICTLVSSLTESQVVAAVLGFAMLFLGYMMDSICSLISSTGNILTKLLRCYDLYTPFYKLMNGTLDIGSVVYYLSFIALMLYMTVLSIQRRRYSLSLKNFSFSAYSTGRMAAALAVVVALNLLVSEMPVTWTSVDLTEQKLYTLTDQTKEYLENLDQDVTIYVIVNENKQDTVLGETLMRYADLSDHVKVEYVDPAVNPRFYQQYTSGSISSNSLIVVSDKRSKVVDYSDIYETETSMDYTTYSYTTNTTGYDGEGQITSALDYVTRDDMPKVYFTSGHGEYSLSSNFERALSKQNVEYEEVNLMNHDVVPEDAACVFINSAVKDFSADDTEKILNYLKQGGKVVVITGFSEEEMPNLASILDYMGLEVADGIIVEQDKDQYYRIPYYLLPSMTVNTYTSGLYGEFYLFAPYAQGIMIQNEEAENMVYDSFLMSSETSFIKSTTENLEEYSKGEDDPEGPFAIGVEAVRTLDDGEAVMVVFGSEQIFTDEADSMVSGANRQLFTNTVSSFIDQPVNISIPVKSYEVSYLTISQSDVLLWTLFTTIALPLGCLIAGIVICVRRRRH